jgi:hypothetical protein
MWAILEGVHRLLALGWQDWPKAAQNYARWAEYQMEVAPLPLQFQLALAAPVVLLAGLILLWFYRRAGLHVFVCGLLLQLYGAFPYVPSIASGVNITVTTIANALAGAIITAGMFGGLLGIQQTANSLQTTSK